MTWGAYALFFALLFMGLRLVAPNVFAYVTAPVLRASAVVGESARGFFGSFGERSALTRENDALRAHNAALALENQALSQRLEAIGMLSLPAGSRPAGVIARPPQSPYDTLVIASGTKDGAAEGMTVFGPGGVPLGIVASALDRFSRVALFSAPGSTLAGWVGENVPVEIRGAGGGAFVGTVPRTAGVAAGDIVYAAGPGKLPLGRVARIESDPALSGVTLHIQGAVNLFSLSWVELRDGGTAGFEAAGAAPSP